MIVKHKKKRNLLETIFLVEILKGMGLTLRRMFSKPVTCQYPTEKRQPSLGFRGKHALVRNPHTQGSKCVACLRCVTICPSQCISIRFHQDEENGPRLLDSYEIEALRCIYCGYCAEVCPVNAILLTESYEYSSYDRQSIFFDQEKLLANWDEFMDQGNHNPHTYVNPFWRPRGCDIKGLAAPRRKAVPEEWTREGQIVGRKHKAAASPAPPEQGAKQ
ncbi:MAG: NADH-quinone oxidoreductase subunit NuoI [Desulfobulbaceae bacterium]|nr:MAG: NADH-quinone oxidoreductase subunit NuoI [Desulfobulbaceae bacterium]